MSDIVLGVCFAEGFASVLSTSAEEKQEDIHVIIHQNYLFVASGHFHLLMTLEVPNTHHDSLGSWSSGGRN